MKSNTNISLTPDEIEIIRRALRMAEADHKRNDFGTLVKVTSDLRSKISNAMLDKVAEVV